MKLFISAQNYAKLKFSIYVHRLSINHIFQYVILRNAGEVYILEHVLYISSRKLKKHTRKLMLSNYILLAFINKIYKYFHALVNKRNVCEISNVGEWAPYLSFETYI